MSMEQLVTEKTQRLPLAKQQAVLDFVESLEPRSPNQSQLHSVSGLWTNLAVEITEADMAAGRQAMWSNFPRDDI